MRGYSSAVMPQRPVIPLDISISKKEYRVYGNSSAYEWGVTDDLILAWSKKVLDLFADLRRAVNKAGTLTLDPAWSRAKLVELAKWGKRTYTRFFSEAARSTLKEQVAGMQQAGLVVAPTINSKLALFPWEVLYQGEEEYHDAVMEQFWGVRYPLARVLTPGTRTAWQYPAQQELPLNTLFCLHHKLHHAHQKEWPALRNVVQLTNQCRLILLGRDCNVHQEALHRPIGERLMGYLYQTPHNLLHFACHCKASDAGADALVVSLVQDENNLPASELITLDTFTFGDVKGHFQKDPLIFLNACHSAGGQDTLRMIFNLPQAFIEHGAAAVIATACPVPDRFAAAFARVFYDFFLKQRIPLGEALRLTRRYFWEEHHNPLGLAYGLYSPAHYRLAG